MNFLYKLERKFGRYAIKNLSLVLIICYVAGYVIQIINPYFLDYLTLDPYAIVHGQVWRIVSWVLIPPPGNIFFAVFMLLFYFSIGTALERTWGSFQYNVYIFSGMIFTVIGSFLMMAFCYIFRAGDMAEYAYGISSEAVLTGSAGYFRYLSKFFSTYYINMSIFLAFAATFPDHQVLLMFIIPVKIKWLAIADAVLLVHDMIFGAIGFGRFGFVYPIVIGSSLLNFLVFFFTSRNYIRMNKSQRKMHREYKKRARQERKTAFSGAAKHRCAVCGRTENDGDNLVFRYCSKCEGNYEFCQDHLYTHIHYVKNDKNT
ncbi:MAG: hypothetical protein ACI4EN_06060 [Butyrivibrio sp.]